MIRRRDRRWTALPVRGAVIFLCAAMSGCGTSTAPAVTTGPDSFIDDTTDLSRIGPRRSVQERPQFADIKEWGDKYETDPDSYDNARGFAEVLLASGSFERAIEITSDSLRVFPGDDTLLRTLARAHLGLGEAEAALKALRGGRRTSDWRNYSLQGICLDQLDRHTEARAAYIEALKLSPGNAKIYNNIGLSHALSGEPQRAEEVLRKAMSLDGASMQIRQNLALVLGAQGKFTEAEKISAEDLNPQEVQDNLEYYRWLLTPRRTWNDVGNTPR